MVGVVLQLQHSVPDVVVLCQNGVPCVGQWPIECCVLVNVLLRFGVLSVPFRCRAELRQCHVLAVMFNMLLYGVLGVLFCCGFPWWQLQCHVLAVMLLQCVLNTVFSCITVYRQWCLLQYGVFLCAVCCGTLCLGGAVVV